jgi:hypothetical protein
MGRNRGEERIGEIKERDREGEIRKERNRERDSKR